MCPITQDSGKERILRCLCDAPAARPLPPRKSLVLFAIGVALAACATGCKSVRQARSPAGPHSRVLTYNVNWGAPQPDLALEIIKESNAEIICLQETTPEWESYLRASVAREYPFMGFRSSKGRMGGGLAFLSKVPMQEVAYIPSNTGWFDGWITAFETKIGRIQVLNVHLRPPVGDRGSWTVSGYLFTGDERLKELQRCFKARVPGLAMIVAGDFNDTDSSTPVKWLQNQGFTDALLEFDRYSPTWKWSLGLIPIRRRMDHIVYSRDLSCCAAAVLHAGASDHFPVVATFEKNSGQVPNSTAE